MKLSLKFIFKNNTLLENKMRKIIRLFFVMAAISLLVTGCSKDKDSEPGSSTGSIKASGELSATIDGVTDNTVDSVDFWFETNSTYNYNDLIIGKTKVTNGVFSIKLDTIATKYLYKIKDAGLVGIDDTTSLKISYAGTTAYISDGEGAWIEAYKSKTQVGSLVRTNCTLSQYEADQADQTFKGLAVASYIYCNTSVTIIGTLKHTDTDNSYTYNYNVSLNKGWNEVVVQITAVNKPNLTISITANAEPSGMKWLFVPDDEENSKAMRVAKITKSKIWEKLLSK